MASKRMVVGWPFWLTWAVAFLGFPLGGVAALAVVGGVNGVAEGAIGGLATGAVIGGVQWLVLRRRVPLSPLWIAATGAGMAAGLAASVAFFGTETGGNALLLRGALTGLAIGAAQWPVLRRVVGDAAVAWVPTVTAGWAIGWAVTRAVGVGLEPDFSVFGSTGAWAFQFLTGLVLAGLFRRRATALPVVALA